MYSLYFVGLNTALTYISLINDFLIKQKYRHSLLHLLVVFKVLDLFGNAIHLIQLHERGAMQVFIID